MQEEGEKRTEASGSVKALPLPDGSIPGLMLHIGSKGVKKGSAANLSEHVPSVQRDNLKCNGVGQTKRGRGMAILEGLEEGVKGMESKDPIIRSPHLDLKDRRVVGEEVAREVRKNSTDVGIPY